MMSLAFIQIAVFCGSIKLAGWLEQFASKKLGGETEFSVAGQITTSLKSIETKDLAITGVLAKVIRNMLNIINFNLFIAGHYSQIVVQIDRRLTKNYRRLTVITE
jgi:hypothetical protein